MLNKLFLYWSLQAFLDYNVKYIFVIVHSTLTQRIIREKYAEHRGVDTSEISAEERQILKQTVARCVQEAVNG